MDFLPGYYCDKARHLVCVPYSVLDLHAMAAALGINRCWYHAGRYHPHYDIPKGIRVVRKPDAKSKTIELSSNFAI